MRLPLLGGAYQARSIIANAQRCVNLFPELNPKDAPVQVTHYQRPGLVKLVQGPNLPVRGVWQASNGNGYCVIGQNVYAVSNVWALTLIGALTVPLGTPVSFVDNGITGLLVDNSMFGYSINLATNAFAQIVDVTGTFQGATRVDYIDTFIIWNMPGTNRYGSTLSNSLVFDPLYFAAKTNWPDPLQTLIVNRHEILLMGTYKSEIWYDAGNPTFPFSELPGAYIEHGIVAPFSLAAQDINVFWLHRDLQGQGMVLRQRGYETRRISNHALEHAIQGYATISDAIGYCYQQDGHAFYVLCFPTADATWVFDDATEMWHQRAWTDGNGVLHRDRSNCYGALYGKNVVGDWENGTLYAMDLNTYTDNGGPISFIRGFPHITMGNGPDGKPADADGRRLTFTNFRADLEVGTTQADDQGVPPQVGLRWSMDRGKTFGQTVLQTAGAQGEYLTQPQWRQNGIGRDVIFELSYSFAGPAALNGAWVEATVNVS